MKNDISGNRYGHWTVIQKDKENSTERNTRWICRCDCGTIKSVLRSSLTCGGSKSCGCQANKGTKGINQTHGMSKTRLYHEWVSMRRRCNKEPTCKKNLSYKNISVCDEWNKNFEPFMKWALQNGYSDALTIDRVDNAKGYSPENCRWITNEEQQRNKTNNVKIEYEGKEWCLRTLCLEIGFPYKLAHQRYKRAQRAGKSISTEKLFEPIHYEKIAYKYRNQKSSSM